jgi:hypothetical protein
VVLELWFDYLTWQIQTSHFNVLDWQKITIKLDEEISEEDEWDMCGREDHMLATKHGWSFNPMSHEKITSLWEKSQ